MLIEQDFEINANLMEKANKEIQRISSERFSLFTDEVSSISASDLMELRSIIQAVRGGNN